MSARGDWDEDMERFALDPDTADRLLSGVLDPEDAPHQYGEVASLLRIAAGPTSGARDGEAAAVAAVVEAIRSIPSPAPEPVRGRSGRRIRLRASVAALVAALTLTGSLAAADALPAPAQQVAADALAVVGVHVPNHSHAPADHPRSTVEAPSKAPGTTAPALGSSTVSTSRTETTLRPGTTPGVPAPGESSTTTVTAPSQPGNGAGRPLTTAPTPAPHAGTPEGAPAPKGSQPSAAPAPTSSPAPQKQAVRPAAGPEAGNGNGNGNANGNGNGNGSAHRADPQRGSPNGQGASHRATPSH